MHCCQKRHSLFRTCTTLALVMLFHGIALQSDWHFWCFGISCEQSVEICTWLECVCHVSTKLLPFFCVDFDFPKPCLLYHVTQFSGSISRRHSYTGGCWIQYQILCNFNVLVAYRFSCYFRAELRSEGTDLHGGLQSGLLTWQGYVADSRRGASVRVL